MAFHITTQFGNVEHEPAVERMEAVLRSIDAKDQEHTDVSLTHESEWCISVSTTGLITFENLEEGDPRHLKLGNPLDALPLWQKLARGELDALEKEPWKQG